MVVWSLGRVVREFLGTVGRDRLSAHKFQILAHGYYLGAAVFFENEQIAVAGYDVVCGGEGALRLIILPGLP